MPIKPFDYINPQTSTGVSSGRIKPFEYEKTSVVVPSKPSLSEPVGRAVTSASDFLAGAAEAPTYTGNSWGETFKNLPNEIVRTLLPGAAALNDNAELAAEVTNEDLLRELPGAAAQVVIDMFVKPAIKGVAEAPALATLGLYNPAIKFGVPFLGDIKNAQQVLNERQDAGEDIGIGEIAYERTVGLLDALFFLSFAAKGFAGRPQTITGKGKVSTTIPAEPGPKSGQLYQPQVVKRSIAAEEFEAIVRQNDIPVNPRYDSANPVFFQAKKFMPDGTAIGQFFQVRPSYFDTFIKALKSDPSKIPSTEIVQISLIARNANDLQAPPSLGPGKIKPYVEPSTASEKLPQSREEAATRYYDEVIAPARGGGQAIVVGADDLKYHFGNDFDRTRHPIYSQAANDVLMRLAKENESPQVIFTAGGPGSGKSEVITQFLRPTTDGVIYDSNLSNLEGALKQIGELEEMGKSVQVVWIARDPESAYKFVKMREAGGKHPVSDTAFVNNHAGIPDVLEGLIEKGKNVIAIDVRGIDTLEGYKALKVSADTPGTITSTRRTKDDIVKILNENNNPIPGNGTAAGAENGAVSRRSKAGGDKGQKDSVATGSSEALRGKTITVKPAVKKPTAKIAGKVTVTPVQRISKTDLRAMIKTLPGSKADFTVVEKGGQKRMTFVTPSGTMSLRPSALGLVEDNIDVGDIITISANDLKATGTSLRGIDQEGNVSAMPRNSAGSSMSKGSAPIDSFESRIGEPVTETPKKDFKLYRKVDELIKKYAERVGEGYLPRGAAGVFYHDTHTIRLTGMNDLSVAAHEITHRLDLVNEISPNLMKVTGTSKAGNPIYDSETRIIRKELTEVYVNHYPGGRADHKLKLRMVEGYATLLQKYVEAPITTTQNYPNLVAEMFISGGKFYRPVIGEIVSDLKSIVEEYQALNPLDKVGARVTSDLNPTGKQTFLSAEEEVTTFVADEVYPHEKVAKETGVAMTVKDPSIYIRRYKGLGSVFARNTTPGNGYWGFNGDAFVKIHDANWGDLQKGLYRSQLYDQFGHYLVARDQHFNFQELARMKQEVLDMKKSIERMGGVAVARKMVNEDGVSLFDEYQALKQSYLDFRDQLTRNGFSEDVVRESYLQNKDRFADESKQYDTLVHEDLVLWHKVGRVTDEQFEKLSAKEGYASLKRQFYDQIAGDERVMGSGTPAKRASSLKHRTGSTRTIIHPVLNGIKNHAEITRKAMKQHIENLMVEAASTNALPDVFQKVQVIRVKDANTGAITYPQEKDPQILMGFIGGNPKARVAFEMDSSLKNSLNEILSYESAGFFGKLLVGANRLFVKGTTGIFPGFTLTNISMDQVTLASQTQQNVIPIYGPLNALYKALGNRRGVVYQRMQEYLANGGELHTLVGWQNKSATELVEIVSKERAGILKLVDYIDQGLDILAFPQKWSEIASRFAEYNAAIEAGDSIIVASEKAANVTVSFHKMGSFGGGLSRNIMQNVVKSIPFFNPGLQALYTMYRAGFKRGAGSRNRLLVVMLALVAAQVAAFGLTNMRGTKKQKDTYTGLSPEEIGGYIWYPNPNGETLVKVRLPNNLNVVGTLVNMGLADRYWGANYQANEYVAAGTAFLPSQMNPLKPANMVFGWLPQAVKIPVGYAANVKDFPAIRAIESESQLRKEPGQRSTPQTPLVLKWVGEKYNISPVKLEFLVTGVFGRASGFLTVKPGVYNPLSVLEKEYYFESSRQVQKYYDLKKENDQRYNTFKDNPGTFSIPETNTLLEERGKLDQVDKLLEALGSIDEEKQKTQTETLRRQILKTIESL